MSHPLPTLPEGVTSAEVTAAAMATARTIVQASADEEHLILKIALQLVAEHVAGGNIAIRAAREIMGR